MWLLESIACVRCGILQRTVSLIQRTTWHAHVLNDLRVVCTTAKVGKLGVNCSKTDSGDSLMEKEANVKGAQWGD
jgi:hypothetical protein